MQGRAHDAATPAKMQPPSTHVLLVEDRGDLAAMYRLAFDLAGFETRIAGTGTEGVAIAESGWPQVIILDLQLPDVDGFAVMDALGKKDVHTPVIFLSITDDGVAIRRAMSLGAVDYLVKPRVKPGDVVWRIRQHLGMGGEKPAR